MKTVFTRIFHEIPGSGFCTFSGLKTRRITALGDDSEPGGGSVERSSFERLNITRAIVTVAQKTEGVWRLLHTGNVRRTPDSRNRGAIAAGSAGDHAGKSCFDKHEIMNEHKFAPLTGRKRRIFHVAKPYKYPG